MRLLDRGRKLEAGVDVLQSGASLSGVAQQELRERAMRLERDVAVLRGGRRRERALGERASTVRARRPTAGAIP